MQRNENYDPGTTTDSTWNRDEDVQLLREDFNYSFDEAKEDYVHGFAETLISVERARLTNDDVQEIKLSTNKYEMPSRSEDRGINSHSDGWRELSCCETPGQSFNISSVGTSALSAHESGLSCSLCQRLFVEPMTLICGHTFCGSCIRTTDSSSKEGTATTTAKSTTTNTASLVCACPSCGFDSKTQKYSINFTLREIVRAAYPEESALEERIISIKNTLILSETDMQGVLYEIESLLKTHPNNIQLICLRSKALYKAGQPGRALRDLEDVCDPTLRDGYTAVAFFTRGEILASAGMPKQASVMFLRACALLPQSRLYKDALISSLRELFRDIREDRYLPPSCVPASKIDIFSVKNCENTQKDQKQQQQRRRFWQEGSGLTHDTSQRIINTQLRESLTTEVMASRVSIDQFECQLCCNDFYQPVTTPCGHTCCKECLLRSLDRRSTCPCCRSNLEEYVRFVVKKAGQPGVCQAIENVQRTLYEDQYQARKVTHDMELNHVVESDAGATPTIPIFVCTLAVPTITCPLHIFEPRYKLMIRRCLENGSRQFGMCAPDPQQHGQFAVVGTMLEIVNVEFLPDGRSMVHTIGGTRFKVLTRHKHSGYNTATVEWLFDNDNDSTIDGHSMLVSQVYNLMVRWSSNLPTRHQICMVEALGHMPEMSERSTTNGFNWLWWLVAAIPLNLEAKLIILSMTSVAARLGSMKRFLEFLLKQHL